MARFVGTRRSNSQCVALLGCSILLVGTLSGCQVVDTLNSLKAKIGWKEDEQVVRVDPDEVVNPFDPDYESKYGPIGNTSGDAEPSDIPFGSEGEPGVWETPNPDVNSDSTGDSSTDNNGGVTPNTSSSLNWSMEQKIVPADFKPSEASVAVAEQYSLYLQDKVYAPVRDILKALPYNTRSHLYFRVMNAGQNFDSEENLSSTADALDECVKGTLHRVGGTTLSTFVTQWLGQLEYNTSNIEAARSRWKSQLEAYELDEDLTWLEASADADINKKLLLMWGNERTGATTFGEYMDMVDEQSIGVIPDISYRFYSTPTSYGTVYLNSTSSQSGAKHFVDGLAISDVNKVFTSHNQFVTRDATVIDTVLVDDSSVLNCYLDGYNKMLVYLAAEPGYTLKGLLGDDYSTVVNALTTAYRPNNITKLYTEIEGLRAVPSGTKGVD